MTDYNFKPKPDRRGYGWYGKGHLPHLDAEGFTQFVTFRLADSLPRTLIDKLRSEAADDVGFRKAVESKLDAGMGECWLAKPEIAAIVQDALIYHNAVSYDLHAWVIMPNHGHLLATQLGGKHLPDILHSIKSFTANAANKVLGRSGAFWQHESFDRYIRSNKHYSTVVDYIELNPVKAGLCSMREEWPWSSAGYSRQK